MNDSYYPKEATDMRGRYLPIGAMATTKVTGPETTHRIVGRRWVHDECQSGILFRLEPPIAALGGPDAWVDADWFSPAPDTKQQPTA